MAEVVVHERSDTQYQQNHEPGLAEDTIISSTRGTDHNQSPYEEVAVTFSTKLPESKMSLLSTNSRILHQQIQATQSWAREGLMKRAALKKR